MKRLGVLMPTRILFLICMTVIVAICCPHAFGQSYLPPEVRAAILQRKILESARRNDLPGVLAEIEEYKSLKVPMSPALLLVEAKAAHRTGDPLRAFTALKDFLAVGQRGSKGYDEALGLYSEFEKEAAPAIEEAEKSRELAERERVAADDEEKAAQEEKKAFEAPERSGLVGEIRSRVESCDRDEPKEEAAVIAQCDSKRGLFSMTAYRACIVQFRQYYENGRSGLGRSRAFDDCYRAITPLCKRLKALDPSSDDYDGCQQIEHWREYEGSDYRALGLEDIIK
jgi:hypothetical protein